MSRHIWATCSSRGSQSDLWPLARLSQGTLKAISDAHAPPEGQLDHCSSHGYFLEFAQTTWSQGWEVSLPHFSVSSVHWNWQLRSQDHDLCLDRGTRACAGSRLTSVPVTRNLTQFFPPRKCFLFLSTCFSFGTTGHHAAKNLYRAFFS